MTLSEQGIIERDAERARLLERLKTLAADSQIHGEDDMYLDLDGVLEHYEKRWGIKVSD